MLAAFFSKPFRRLFEWLFASIGSMGAGAYPGVFLLLFFAGWLVPLPEEPTVILAGYATKNNGLSLPIMIAVVLAGVLCGDLVIFWIGRRHGDWVFRLRFFRWILPPERLDQGRRLFAENGSKAAFFGRFIAGVRLVVFFMAGNLGVPVATFILYDFLATLLTIPAGVIFGWWFKDEIDKAVRYARRSEWVVIGIVAALLVYVLVKRFRRRPAPAAPAGDEPAKTLEKAEHA
ncbi:MAG TPA: DedA family protein [Planctomycetota bacterium]|nr:DedA family protein [Planctomycetota bacterium]